MHGKISNLLKFACSDSSDLQVLVCMIITNIIIMQLMMRVHRGLCIEQ